MYHQKSSLWGEGPNAKVCTESRERGYSRKVRDTFEAAAGRVVPPFTPSEGPVYIHLGAIGLQ